jgi:hypothetical protein
MSNDGRFRVGLHVSHPSLPVDGIVSAIALNPRYARSAGDPRITKDGKNLGGIYKRTDVTFEVSDGVLNSADVLLPEFLNNSIDRLARKAIEQVVTSGGSCYFLIGIFSEASILFNFDAELLAKLASHGIGIALDFYGGPENDASPPST